MRNAMDKNKRTLATKPVTERDESMATLMAQMQVMTEQMKAGRKTPMMGTST